jgi:hypothetical protein
MLETYLQNCGAQTQDFTLQQEFTAQLCSIAHHVKTVSGKKSRVKTLRERLSLLSIPASGFRLPVNPNILVKSLVVEKAKLLHSATLPLWLEFDNSDSYAEPFRVIFKAGDDLRQDVLVLQMFEIMNRVCSSLPSPVRFLPSSSWCCPNSPFILSCGKMKVWIFVLLHIVVSRLEMEWE